MRFSNAMTVEQNFFLAQARSPLSDDKLEAADDAVSGVVHSKFISTWHTQSQWIQGPK